MIEPDAYIVAQAIANQVPSELRASTVEGVAKVSIAISLKRIADALAGVPYDPNPGADNSRHRASLTESIGIAIEQGILAGSNR